MMSNRPEYVAWWLCFAKLAVRVAFTNTHITGGALRHAWTSARVRAVVCDAATEHHVAAALAGPASGPLDLAVPRRSGGYAGRPRVARSSNME